MDPLYLDALATLETAGGRKTIKGPNGEDSFNLYNIKDFSGKGYRARDKAEGSNDAYRVYASADESKADLIGLLSRKYPAALEAQSPQQFAEALKAGGYATDPKYVEKFVAVAGSLAGRSDAVGDVQAPAAPTPAPAADRSLAGLYAAAQGPRPPKQFPMKKTAAAVAALGTIAPLRDKHDTEDAWFTRATEQSVDAYKAKSEADQQSLLDIARASWMATFGGAVAKELSRPEYAPDNVPVTEEELVGYTVEEQDLIRSGNSVAERNRYRFEIDNARENLREAGKSGLGWAIAGGMIAGAPEAIAAGGMTTALLARAGLGSLALAEQGRRAAALGSLAVENVGVGAAMTAGLDYLTPDVHLQDYIIGALGDSLGMALHAPRILAGSRSVESEALGRILDDAAQSKKADIDTARKELGSSATPAEVNKRAQQLQGERLRLTLEAQRTELSADRKLLPDDVNEELLGDAAEAKPSEPSPLFRGVTQAWDESARQDIEFWSPDAAHAGKYAGDNGQVVFTTQRPKNPRVIDEADYNLGVLESAYADRATDGVVVMRDGKELLVATFNKPALSKVGGPDADLQLPPLSDDIAAASGIDPRFLNMPYNGTGLLNERVLNTTQLRNVGNATEGNLRAAWNRNNPYGVRDITLFERDFGAGYDRTLQDAPERAVHLVNADKVTPEQHKLALWLHKNFLPDQRIVLMDLDATPYGKKAGNASTRGLAWAIGADINLISFRSSNDKWQHTMIHEFGHIIFNRHVHLLKGQIKDGFMSVYDAWLKRYAGTSGENPAQGMSSAVDAAVRRGPVASEATLHALGHQGPEGFIPSLMDVMTGIVQKMSKDVHAVDANGRKYGTDYIPNVREFSAEQFTKYIEAAVADVLDWKPASIPETVRKFFKALWEQFATLFNRAKQAGLIAPEEGVVNFFESVRKSAKSSETMRKRVQAGKDPYGHDADAAAGHEPWQADAAPPQSDGPDLMAVPAGPRTDADIIHDYGLDTLAADSTAQKATLKAMVHLYRKAEAYPMPDEARMSKLLSAAPMQWAAPTALSLMRSKNPVARMVAAELLESGGGAGGRKTSAAIAKWMNEREFMGNAVNDFQRHYTAWRNANGGNVREDFLGGKKFEEFNKLVAVELENRLRGRNVVSDATVSDAADVLTAAYDRMRVKQRWVKTPGWAALPETSEGYMPHRMSAGKVRAMTPDQGRVLHSVLSEQFQRIEGFDQAFSQRLASKYIGIMRQRGTAGYSAPIGVHSAEAADIVEQAAQAMGMTKAEADALAKRIKRAAPKHTQHRLDLDLTQTYMADGQPFRLLDLFETDQLTLLRSQVGRVSGEVALVRHGIMGSTGMKLLRQALDFGTAEGKATNHELEAFDQVAAEMLGQPFGKQAGKWLDRALMFNSLASLGGMGFNQLAETLNGAVSLGVRHALASVGSFRRLRSEIIALSKGQSVNNPIIGSLETYGAEFGTDHYKLVFPFDRADRNHEVYGAETLGVADRLLRAGSHLQGKMSLWRAISSAQERGMAEQIVHKALRYIRDGKSSKALADMGIDQQMIASIRQDLGTAARFDSRGRLTAFDITKLSDQVVADAFVQAVHRGTKQIIQGSFIGETGKWAHSGLLKMMTQFRTFSLVAIDKQWNRQVGNHGTAAALGILLGTMSFAAPIVMIRAGLASIGREDQDKYLERRLHPVNIARETLNYVALSGLSGDLLDALSAVAGYQPTGGRTGANKSFAGNVVAPVVGKVNDLWGAVQNTRDGTNVHDLAQQMPFARLPWLYPAVNSLKPE